MDARACPRRRTRGYAGVKARCHRNQEGAMDPQAGHPNRACGVSPKRFVSGETLPYLGRNVRLIVESADVPLASRSGSITGAFESSCQRAWPNPSATTKSERWLFSGIASAPPSVCHRRLSYGENAWAGRKRWKCSSVTSGSAGAVAPPDGTLRFNWRVVMLPPALIEYVVVHELVHLRVNSHSTEYWALVSSLLADAQQRRRQLRGVGKMLPL